MSLLSMQGGATGTGTVTLLAPVTNTNRTLTLPDATGTVLTTATAGVPVNGPAFSAYLSSDQSVTSGTNVKIAFNTEEFDTNGCYDNTTNYRFTPIVAGYYQVDGVLSCRNATSITRFNIQLWKNGAIFKWGGDIVGTGYKVNVSALVYLNGSTDYIELYGAVTAGTAQFTGDVNSTFFQAFLARSA